VREIEDLLPRAIDSRGQTGLLLREAIWWRGSFAFDRRLRVPRPLAGGFVSHLVSHPRQRHALAAP
jgi:hypothetical protein